MTNTLKVIALNSIICIFQSAVNSNLNIVAQVTDQNGYNSLGNVSIFLIFTFGMIGTMIGSQLFLLNIIAPQYVKKLKFNLIFFLQALGYLFFLFEGIIVCYCNNNSSNFCQTWLIWILVIIGSSITGFSSSGFWIAQNEYISEASNEKNVGMLFGIGWALVQFSQVLGSVYSTYIVEPLGQFNFFCVMLLISTVSSLMFICVSQPDPVSKEKFNEINQSSVDESNLEAGQIGIQDIAKTFFLPKVRLLLFPMMITGIMLRLFIQNVQNFINSFQWNLMHFLIENSIDIDQKDEKINSLTFKVMISLGLMEVIGGIISGVLNSNYPKIKVLISMNLLFEIALVIALANIYIKNYALCFFVAAIWGFVDCSTTTSLLALLSENFGDDVRIFGLFNCMQCVGGMIATIISIIIQNYSIQYSIIVIIAAQMASNMCLQAWDRFQIKAKE